MQTQRWGLHRPNARSKSGRQAGGFSSEQVASGSLLLPLTHSAQRRHAVSSCPPGSDRPHHPALSCHLLACVLSTSRDQTCDETSLRTNRKQRDPTPHYESGSTLLHRSGMYVGCRRCSPCSSCRIPSSFSGHVAYCGVSTSLMDFEIFETQKGGRGWCGVKAKAGQIEDSQAGYNLQT